MRELRHLSPMSGDAPTRVLIVDDDLELGLMLRDYLHGEGLAVTLAGDGETGLAEARSGRHDIVILDIMLPALNGTDLLRSLRQTSQVPVIMLTAKGDNIDRVVGLELGADDYVPKPCFPRELVARMRAVLRRQREIPESPSRTLTCGRLAVEALTRRATIAGTALTLTNSEFDLLLALARGGDAIATKEELSLKVLGRVRQPYDRSVDVHVSNLRHKLGQQHGAPEIETVRGLGYRLRAVA